MSNKNNGFIDKIKNKYFGQYVNENGKFSLRKMFYSDDEYNKYKNKKNVKKIEEYMNNLLKPEQPIEYDEIKLDILLKNRLKNYRYNELYEDIDQIKNETRKEYVKDVNELKQKLIDEENEEYKELLKLKDHIHTSSSIQSQISPIIVSEKDQKLKDVLMKLQTLLEQMETRLKRPLAPTRKAPKLVVGGKNKNKSKAKHNINNVLRKITRRRRHYRRN